MRVSSRVEEQGGQRCQRKAWFAFRGRERGGADRERDWGDAVRLPGLVDAYESEEETYSEPSSYRVSAPK